MSVNITIGNTIIEFPESSESPNWAPPVIEFAQAVEGVLAGVSGSFDVQPTIMNIDTINGNASPVDITDGVTALSFPTSEVRAAFIRYSVFRTTNTTTAYEAGNFIVVYNPNGSSGNKWEHTRDFVGDAQIVLSITDTGQVQFTSVALSGINYTGRITYVAQALLQDT